MSHELCKNVWTDGDAIWDLNSAGPKEACGKWAAHQGRAQGGIKRFIFPKLTDIIGYDRLKLYFKIPSPRC